MCLIKISTAILLKNFNNLTIALSQKSQQIRRWSPSYQSINWIAYMFLPRNISLKRQHKPTLLLKSSRRLKFQSQPRRKMRIYLYTWRNARTMILTTAWRLNDLPLKIEIDDFWIPIKSTAILSGSNQAQHQWLTTSRRSSLTERTC